MSLLLLFRSSGGSATGTTFESFAGGGMYLGRWDIDDYLTFAAQTHDDTGAAADADAVPSYAIYEDETAAAIVTGNMAKLGAVDGFYTERVQLTTASGFEAGKAYTVRVAATVGGVVSAKVDCFCLGGVTLANDAITAAKFDESTAFPVKSADAGSTQIARVGADSDTLETLSDQIDSVKAKTDIITANSITVVSPVNSDGDVSIDRGYDYYATDGRQLTWTDSADITWPDLTDATATFYVGDFLDVACTITDPTGPATITLELSKSNTELLPIGVRPFRIDVELANTHLILQIRGKITVRD